MQIISSRSLNSDSASLVEANLNVQLKNKGAAFGPVDKA